MNHSLPADIQQRINAQIATGDFASDDEVLRDALDALERRQNGLAKLRSMVAEAEEDVAAGRTGSFDRAAIKRDVREQLAKRGMVE